MPPIKAHLVSATMILIRANSSGNIDKKHTVSYSVFRAILYIQAKTSSGASAISEGDIFIYSCSVQLISFEVDSISKEINCAEHEYMNMSPSLIALAPVLTKTLTVSIQSKEFL